MSGRFVAAKEAVDFKYLLGLGKRKPHNSVIADVNKVVGL